MPGAYRARLLAMAHDHTWAGHQGSKNTLRRLQAVFFWPSIERDVRDYCRSCELCQKTSNRSAPCAPLSPLPVIAVPFDRVAMDFIGPLPRTPRGARYLLVIMDYATRYPEAVPLRTLQSSGVARALMRFFAHVGLPREIITDRGSPFTSALMRRVCQALKIGQIFASVQHPQTDGLVERMNQTVKLMLRRLAHDHPGNWDLYVDPLLFALRETPQASTGFAPFELVYGRRPRGIVELAEEQWVDRPREGGLNPDVHVQQLQERLALVRQLARGNLEAAQQAQKRVYDRGTQERGFQAGEQVWVRREALRMAGGDPWQGPFRVRRVLGPLSYEVQCGAGPRRRRHLHVNQLKAWVARTDPESCHLTDPPDELEDGELPWRPEERENEGPNLDDCLSPEQRKDMRTALADFPSIFSAVPGQTHLVTHHIETPKGAVVRVPWRPVPGKQWETINKEVDAMLKMDVIESSMSDWRSPIVLVPKPDGSTRFCVDFREVNRIAKFDAYPMPRAHLLIDQLGKATYLSALDLTKGYWQVPVHPKDREKTAFAAPGGSLPV